MRFVQCVDKAVTREDLRMGVGRIRISSAFAQYIELFVSHMLFSEQSERHGGCE
jgi:hypothetical protein